MRLELIELNKKIQPVFHENSTTVFLVRNTSRLIKNSTWLKI